MLQTRNIIYLNYSSQEQCLYSLGVEFKEFINAIETPINILLLEHQYFGEDFHYGSNFEFVQKDNLQDLLKENVYSYGDFCWVDFDQVQSLDSLSPDDVAELLYLGHMMKPLKSPIFPKLNNRYAYLAHDDGWYNKIFK